MLHNLIESILKVEAGSINLNLFPLRWKLFDSSTDITQDLLDVEYIQFSASAFTVVNNTVSNSSVLEFGEASYTFSGTLTFNLYDSSDTLWFTVSSSLSVLETSELSLPAGSFNIALSTSNYLGNLLLTIIFKQTIPTLPSFYKLQLIKEDLEPFGTAFELSPTVWSYAVLAADDVWEIVYGQDLFRATTSKQKIVAARLLTNTDQLVADLTTFSYFYTFDNNILDLRVRNISVVVSKHFNTGNLYQLASLYKCFLDFDYNYFDRTGNLALSEIAGSFNSAIKQSGITAIELNAEELEYSNLFLDTDFYIAFEFRLKNSFIDSSVLDISDILNISTASNTLQFRFLDNLISSVEINSNTDYKLIIYKLEEEFTYMLNSFSETIQLVDFEFNSAISRILKLSNNSLVSRLYIAEQAVSAYIAAYNLNSFNSRVLASDSISAIARYI